MRSAPPCPRCRSRSWLFDRQRDGSAELVCLLCGERAAVERPSDALADLYARLRLRFARNEEPA